jgi:hypothetical protein
MRKTLRDFPTTDGKADTIISQKNQFTMLKSYQPKAVEKPLQRAHRKIRVNRTT